jgi:hypothetical protein
MRTILTLSIITIIGIFFSPGKPVPGAEVYIEQEGSDSPVLFQQTGDNGKLEISNLSAGLYRIKVHLPQQSGKFMRGFDRIDCRLQVGYHNKKKKYFIREREGCFTIDYSKFNRIAGRNITPVYHVDVYGRGKRVEIGKFEVNGGNNGGLTLELRAQKPKKFQKLVNNLREDVEMITIRNSY